MLLVVWDLTRNDSRKWKGIGIGLAAGIKLVPLIFIPYLLLAGKFRQAAVATRHVRGHGRDRVHRPAEAVHLVLADRVLHAPRPHRQRPLAGQPVTARHAGPASTGRSARRSACGCRWRWRSRCVGLVGGAMLSRAGRPVQGWTLVGITSVLVSPISWDHHWVWIVPFLALLVGLAMTARPLAQGRLSGRRGARGRHHGLVAVAVERAERVRAAPRAARLVREAARGYPAHGPAWLEAADLEPVGGGRDRDLPGAAGRRRRGLA